MSQRPSRIIAIALGAAAGLFLAWQAAETLLLIFAGVLLGILLDTLTRALGRIVPLSHAWCLAIVCLVLVIGFTGLLIGSGYTLVQQWDDLSRVLSNQLRSLRDEIDNLGLRPEGQPANGNQDIQTLAQLLLPDPSRLFGGARTAFSAALGIVGGGLVIVLIAIFAAATPGTYRREILKFAPADRRGRIGDLLDEVVRVLRWWLLGQLVTMAIIGVSIGLILTLMGIPGALVLGIQAGLLNFIPYLGPFLAAAPILLAAIPQGTTMLLSVLAIYVVVQAIEGYVLTPLIQKQAVDLPPVLTLSSLMIFGALFGAAGVAMATPLVAAIRVAVLQWYGDDQSDAARGARRSLRRTA